MSDHNERSCGVCGSLIHYESNCPIATTREYRLKRGANRLTARILKAEEALPGARPTLGSERVERALSALSDIPIQTTILRDLLEALNEEDPG